ncbi:DUF6049 family protein [Tomitella cavernea]|uniref:DUF6049 family protein n=1 Tax=Tomitella cavernea TaxID=1387982 RepID=UPI003CD056BF
MDFTLSLPLNDPATRSLEIAEPGVYPLLVNVNGTPDYGGRARLDDARFLLPVLSLPAGATPTATARQQGPVAPSPVPVTMLYPLTAAPELAAGQPGPALDSPAAVRLVDDSLPRSLAAGGRLHGVLAAAREALGPAADPRGALGAGLCLAIDPDLLVTVDAMTRGFEVSKDPADPDSDASSTDDAESEGQTAAAAWLKDLRELAAQTCTVALPYAQADLDAVRDLASPHITASALAAPADIVDGILGVKSVRDLVWPSTGQVAPATLATVTQALAPAPEEPAAPPRRPRSGRSARGSIRRAHRAHRGQHGGDHRGSENDGFRLVSLGGLRHCERRTYHHGGGTRRSRCDRPPGARVESCAAVRHAHQRRARRRRHSTVHARIRARGPPIQDSRRLAHGAAAGCHGGRRLAIARGPALCGVGAPHRRLRERIRRRFRCHRADRAARRCAAPGLDSRPRRGLRAAGPAAARLPGRPRRTATPEYRARRGGGARGAVGRIDRSQPGGRDCGGRRGRVQVRHRCDGRSRLRFHVEHRPICVGLADRESPRPARPVGNLARNARGNGPDGETPEHYITPLYRDVLRAVSTWGRGGTGTSDARAAAEDRTAALTASLTDQFDAVTVVAPGSVYTLASSQSPLLVVAKNDLAMPVNASLRIRAPEGVQIGQADDYVIPARGSRQIQVPAQIEFSRQMDLRVQLLAPDSTPIGEQIHISLHSNAYGMVIPVLTGISGALLLFLAGRRGWHRLRGQHDRADDRASERGPVLEQYRRDEAHPGPEDEG